MKPKFRPSPDFRYDVAGTLFEDKCAALKAAHALLVARFFNSADATLAVKEAAAADACFSIIEGLEPPGSFRVILDGNAPGIGPYFEQYIVCCFDKALADSGIYVPKRWDRELVAYWVIAKDTIAFGSEWDLFYNEVAELFDAHLTGATPTSKVWEYIARRWEARNGFLDACRTAEFLVAARDLGVVGSMHELLAAVPGELAELAFEIDDNRETVQG